MGDQQMRVIKTEGRGPNTVYTVHENGKTWEIKGASNLPEEVFQNWRRHQSKVCMSNKRAKDPKVKVEVKVEVKSEVKPQVKTEVKKEVKPQVKTEVKSEKEPKSEPETTEQPNAQANATPDPQQQLNAAAQRAFNLVTCKICHEAEVKRLIVPCGHLVFCAACLKKALTQKSECPICLSPVADWIGAMMIE